MKEKYNVGRRVIEIVEGNITEYDADAIVVPSNPDLDYTGLGIQRSITNEGGVEIINEAIDLAEQYAKEHGMSEIGGIPGRVPLYSAHLTKAGRLPARHVIHSVARGYRNSRVYCDGEGIRRSIRNVLDLGRAHGFKSIGFPLIGTGLYGAPLEESLEGMVNEFQRELRGSTSIERLGLIVFTDNFNNVNSFVKKQLTD